MSVPVHHGRFGPREAERLLWRAGFGPGPGEVRKLRHRSRYRLWCSLLGHAAAGMYASLRTSRR